MIIGREPAHTDDRVCHISASQHVVGYGSNNTELNQTKASVGAAYVVLYADLYIYDIYWK